MSNLPTLIADNLDIWTSATQRKSGAGRGGGKRISLYGIERLRALILDLAVRGKLVPQDAGDEPAAALLPKMAAERQRRIKAREMKAAKGPSKASSEPFDLPPGWMWLPLWQTGNIFTGNSINSSLRAELEANNQGRPFVATKDVGYGLEAIDYDNGLTVTLDDQRFNVAKPNSVFICAEGGSAGRKMAISDRAIAFGNKLIANEPWPQLEPRYILYTYLSDFFFGCFSKEMTGIIGGISRAKFLALPFPLPPLAEQRRIVAKVDELMALCDALERESADAMAAHAHLVDELLGHLVNSADAADLAANWARLESLFDTLFTTEASIDALKQTILDLAVRGKLVPQDAGDESADHALERLAKTKSDLVKSGQLKRVKNNDPLTPDEHLFSVPVGWCGVRFGNAVDVRDGTHDSPKDANGPDTYPLVTSKDFKDGKIDFSTSRRISASDHHAIAQRSFVERDDILFSMIGGNIGNQVMVTTDEQFSIKNVALFKYFSKEITLPRYVKIFTENLANRLQAEASGGAQPFVSLGYFRDLFFPFPPVAEQQRIVAKVDALMALCDALKARLSDAAQTRCHLADAITERAAA